MERKTARFELKDADPEKGIVTGYAAVFGTLDDGGDIIEPGAFAKTLSERGDRIKVLYGHSFDRLVGKSVTAREDAKGLYTESRITLKSFWGNEVYQHLLNGALDEMSIGYATVKASPDPDRPVRRVAEIRLYEYSFVPLAMHPDATVESVKSLLADPDQLARLAELLETEGKALARNVDHRLLLTKAHAALSAALERVEPVESKDSDALDAITPDQRAALLRRIEIARMNRGRQLVGV